MAVLDSMTTSPFSSRHPLLIATKSTLAAHLQIYPQGTCQRHKAMISTGPFVGSVSDFGGSDDGKRGNNVESDDDIPTQDEIQATSSRIFGVTQSAGRGANAGSPSLPQSSSIISPITDTLSFDFLRSEPETDEDDDPHDIAPFEPVKSSWNAGRDESGNWENGR